MEVRVLASSATDVRGVQALAAAHGLPCTVEVLGMGSEAERSHYRKLKAQHDLPPSDPTREAAQIARLEDLANRANLDPEFAKKFLNFIIAEVIQHHQKHHS